MIIEIPDLKLRNPYLSIAIEEVLAEYYGKQEDFTSLLRFWLNPPTIVLGRSCKVFKNVKPEIYTQLVKNLSDKKVYLTRRLSGGGTVYHSLGILNYTIMIPLKKYPVFMSVSESYEILLNMVIRALEKQNIFACIQGLSDLAIKTESGIKKFSGNSQFRKYGVLVHHGSLILNKKVIEEIENILEHPPKEPDYRKKRSHKDFLTHLPMDFDISLFYNCLLEEIKNYFHVFNSRLIHREEFNRMKRLLIHKIKHIYRDYDWIYNGKYTYREIIKQ